MNKGVRRLGGYNDLGGYEVVAWISLRIGKNSSIPLWQAGKYLLAYVVSGDTLEMILIPDLIRKDREHHKIIMTNCVWLWPGITWLVLRVEQ